MIPVPGTLLEEIRGFRMRLGGTFGGLVLPSPTDAAPPLGREVFQHALAAAVTHAQLPAAGGCTPSGGTGPLNGSIILRLISWQLVAGARRVLAFSGVLSVRGHRDDAGRYVCAAKGD